MAKENAVLSENETLEEELTESFDLNELEGKLQNELEKELSDLEFLKEEKEHIGSPDALGETTKNIVWEQFLNQVAVTAGEDFIKENHGLHLDLRDSAHIQTAENFGEGKIATHNNISKEQLEQNYDRFNNKPHGEFRDEHVDPGMNATLKRAGDLKKQGIDAVTDIYTGKQIPTQTKLENGKNNPQAAQREHVKSSAELYENPSLQMANTNEELAAIINNPENLQGYTTAERNNRKSDNSANEMSEQDKTKHWEKANDRAEEYVKQKKQEGEERLKKEGRKTQKEEAFRIGGKALRAVAMQLLAELVKEIIGKLVKWFKDTKRNIDTLIEILKTAIKSFVSKLKNHMVNAGNTLLTTIATAIIGPIVGTIKKVWMMLKQGWKSLKEAIDFLRNPKNKSMPISIKLLEVGKIVMAGLSGVGALVLGEFIEKGLITIPVFAVEIPQFGSLANVVGIFMGAVVAGIIGAIAINLIDKATEKKRKQENTEHQVEKSNEILNTQHKIKIVNEAQLENDKANAQANISGRHQEAGAIMKDSFGNIMEDFVSDFSDSKSTLVIDEEDIKTNNELDKISDDLDNILKSLD